MNQSDRPGSAALDILIVEDHQDSSEMLAAYLSHHGYLVATASQAPDAVRAVRACHPRLVLMDLALPGEYDGWEATRLIKTDPAVSGTVILAVSAHAQPHDRSAALRAGCADFIVKPIDLGTLLAAVRGVLGASQRGPQRREVDGPGYPLHPGRW